MIPFFTKDGKLPKFLPNENDIKRRKNTKIKPTATTTKCKHYSRKEELKQLEQFFRKMPNISIILTPLRVAGKKKGKKR